ncbi:MAG: hypothetical protein ACLFSI_08535 [Halorhodospira sp.]
MRRIATPAELEHLCGGLSDEARLASDQLIEALYRTFTTLERAADYVDRVVYLAHYLQDRLHQTPPRQPLDPEQACQARIQAVTRELAANQRRIQATYASLGKNAGAPTVLRERARNSLARCLISHEHLCAALEALRILMVEHDYDAWPTPALQQAGCEEADRVLRALMR